MADNYTPEYQAMEDSLNILRQRATCPVCAQIYNQPKRLTNCRHVFCLTCIKRYMETKRPINFPPCPVCRAPIMKAIQDVNTLESAGAEEDIVTAVRQFETCNICQRKENPNQKCLDCNSLICDNCIPSHDQFNPIHTKIGLLSLSTSIPESSTRKCSLHKDQLFDLYCILCRQVLCHVCEKYNHNACTKRSKSWKMQYHLREMFTRGLLKDYILSDEERKVLYYQSFDISPVVQLNEFSSHCRRFLKDPIQTELEECIFFFKAFQDHVDALRGKEPTHLYPFHRINDLFTELSKLVKTAEALKNVITSEVEKSTNAEIVKCILDIELDCVLLFKIRKTFSLEMKPLVLVQVDPCINAVGSIFKQTFDCILQTNSGTFGSIVMLGDGTESLAEYYAKTQFKRVLCRTNHMKSFSSHNHSASKWLSALFYGKVLRLREKHNLFLIHECERRSIDPKQKYSKKRCLMDVREAVVYSNTALEMNKLVFSAPCVNDSSDEETGDNNNSKYNTANILEIEQGFTTTFPKTRCTGATRFTASNSQTDLAYIDVIFGRPFPDSFSSMTLETPFINVFVFPIIHNAKWAKLENTGSCSFDKEVSACLACVTGNRSPNYGLETILVYFGESTNDSHGICLGAARIKYKIGCFDGQRTNFEMYRNSKNLFSLSSVLTSDRFEFSYRTIGDDNSELETTLNCRQQLTQFGESTSFSFSVRNIEADLVCFLKEGAFIVNRSHDELQIRKLKLPSCEIDTIHSVKEQNISVPVENLIPLTVAELKNNEVVVLCGIQGDNSKFILSFPQRNATVEMLEVRYPNNDLAEASVVELEIAPDGTVMFVLEKEEGEYVCVSTKYLLP